MDIKAEIAKKLARGELVSDSYLKRHRTGVERVIGHTAVGDFHTELVASQEGSESWTVIVTVKNKPEVWVEYRCGRHLPYKLNEFNAQFPTGSANGLPTVDASVNHPVHKDGKVTHVITEYTMIHECTAFVDGRRRATKPWECNCVRFRNTKEHCDGLLYLLLSIFRIDPLEPILIRPMFDISCHPHAQAACSENGFGLPGATGRDVLELPPKPGKVAVGMYLIDPKKYADEVKRICSERHGPDQQTYRFHEMNDRFKRLVPIGQQSDANAATVIMSLTACFEQLTTTCPAGGSIVVNGKQATTHIASGQAPALKRPREARPVQTTKPLVTNDGGEVGDDVAQASKARKKSSCRFCSAHFDVEDSERDLSHCRGDKCMLKKHPYDPNGHWLLSLASVLGSSWTKDDPVQFNFPGGRSLFAQIPRARYPTAKEGDKFRLVMGGLSHVFSEEHLQRAPLWEKHKMP
jgi:hypothetical protein